MNNQTLTTVEEVKAKQLYNDFWSINPKILNPTDINSQEKYDFFMKKSYEDLSLMQKARKQAYSFTKK